MKFTKMHGAGNDYVYIDARDQEENWPTLAEEISNRHFGVGSDGLILALDSQHADLRMTMFNTDGSEGEMCGNGIRCLVGFALKHGIVPKNRSPVIVETLRGNLSVTPIWNNGIVTRATVEMGEPIWDTSEIPVNLPGYDIVWDFPLIVNDFSFEISCVSMGNPHAVAFVDMPVSDIPLDVIGPMIEHHDMFPNRVNFEIANVSNPNHIDVRVWERGSGETLACGTGACAVVAVGNKKGYADEETQVSLPGGNLVVRWPGHGQIVLDGPVQEVFEGEWPR